MGLRLQGLLKLPMDLKSVLSHNLMKLKDCCQGFTTVLFSDKSEQLLIHKKNPLRCAFISINTDRGRNHKNPVYQQVIYGGINGETHQSTSLYWIYSLIFTHTGQWKQTRQTCWVLPQVYIFHSSWGILTGGTSLLPAPVTREWLDLRSSNLWWMWSHKYRLTAPLAHFISE